MAKENRVRRTAGRLLIENSILFLETTNGEPKAWTLGSETKNVVLQSQEK